MEVIACRACSSPLKETFADLKLTPIANELIESKNNREEFFPLHAKVCENCWLVQLNYTYPPKNIFSDKYPYYSSWSKSWLKHAEEYVSHITNILKLEKRSLIVEVASNDGYLLQYFKKGGYEVLGIEPCKNLAIASEKKDIPTINKFFNRKTAIEILKKRGSADLIVANNVLAHVPDILDFLAGFKVLLGKSGIITFEFPYIFELIINKQFDTIYHEHYFYFSVHAIKNTLKKVGLKAFNVEYLKTHGGSLRLYVCHINDSKEESLTLVECHNRELKSNVNNINTYKKFQTNIIYNKFELIKGLIKIKKDNKKIIGYGAPAKGNTLLNYCGIGQEFLDYTVDISTQKQGKYLPGSRLEIRSIDVIKVEKPDYILILPWNLSDEIMTQISYVKTWDCKFIIAIPNFKIIK